MRQAINVSFISEQPCLPPFIQSNSTCLNLANRVIHWLKNWITSYMTWSDESSRASVCPEASLVLMVWCTGGLTWVGDAEGKLVWRVIANRKQKYVSSQPRALSLVLFLHPNVIQQANQFKWTWKSKASWKGKNESSPTACREYAKVGESSGPHCLRRWCSGCILKALKSSIPSFILSPTLVNCPNQCLINYIIDTPKILVLEKLWQ